VQELTTRSNFLALEFMVDFLLFFDMVYFISFFLDFKERSSEAKAGTRYKIFFPIEEEQPYTCASRCHSSNPTSKREIIPFRTFSISDARDLRSGVSFPWASSTHRFSLALYICPAGSSLAILTFPLNPRKKVNKERRSKAYFLS